MAARRSRMICGPDDEQENRQVDLTNEAVGALIDPERFDLVGVNVELQRLRER